MTSRLFDSIDPTALEALTALALTVGTPLLLATARIAGLVQAAPVTGDRTVPLRTRLALAACLALLVLPVLTAHGRPAEAIAANVGNAGDSGWPATAGDSGGSTRVARSDPGHPAADAPPSGHSTASLAEAALILMLAGEFLLGYLLGTGVRLILAGLQLAGNVIDPQAGLAIGQTWNPLTASQNSLTGSLIVLAGLAAFLLPPFHGDLVLVAALLDSFAAIPVGGAVAVDSVPVLVATWMQQSTSLALRIAAPFLATVSLVTLSAAFLARGSGGMARSGLAIAPRIGVSLVVLGLSLGGAMDAVVISVQDAIGWTLNLLASG
ncbi:flagellar biosynthesis protein FliR [Maioricimonas rarisocia]|uniref:Flagellar biosynthesis protein FliR n=1 Tax=Maioricimonas rarisocia TaxID=2528026 RepID=A0A517ZDY9_9PLAN|nr:flagellar biosynthetic protein FliR [Maioricimonas rarisocia]QDU40693.1 flagellar biosynthesis protein FliR [Maioricimonas rarisocia]